MWRLLIIGLIICASKTSDALKCYSCVHAAGGADAECVSNPEDVAQNAIIECDKKYCTSIRTEFIETKNGVASIYRMCDDKYIFKNKVQLDPYFRVHYVACETDLCNGGDGRIADTSRDPDDGDEILLIIPGVQNGNAFKVFNNYLICLILAPYLFKFISLFI